MDLKKTWIPYERRKDECNMSASIARKGKIDEVPYKRPLEIGSYWRGAREVIDVNGWLSGGKADENIYRK